MAQSTTSDRIWFVGNPWPNGHKIEEFEWEARLEEGDAGQPKEVWFCMSLLTEDYYAEDSEDENDDEDVIHPNDRKKKKKKGSDWTSKRVWSNYHSCSLSCDDGGHGFRLCTQEQYNPDFLDGREIEVDMQRDLMAPTDDEPAFSICLLGHDSVGFHRFRFERLTDSDKFKILWSGKIALSYGGQTDFKYDFKAVIGSAKFPKLKK